MTAPTILAMNTRGYRMIDVADVTRIYGLAAFDCGLYQVRVRGIGLRFVRTAELARILFAGGAE